MNGSAKWIGLFLLAASLMSNLASRTEQFYPPPGRDSQVAGGDIAYPLFTVAGGFFIFCILIAIVRLIVKTDKVAGFVKPTGGHIFGLLQLLPFLCIPLFVRGPDWLAASAIIAFIISPILLFSPVLILNSMTQPILRSHGLHVGFWGASRSQLDFWENQSRG
jgi:hypothetical protein